MYYEIIEYENSEAIELTQDEIEYLNNNHYNHLSIIKSSNNSYILKAKYYVGFISLNNEKIIQIKTKVPNDNLMFMISYLYQQIESGNDINLMQDRNTGILDVIINVLINWVKKLIKRGLHKTYLKKEKLVSGVKGKILLSRNFNLHHKLYCNFDDISHSNLENCILKATLRNILLMKNVNNYLKGEAKKIVKVLSNIEDINLSEGIFNKLRFSRLNSHYIKLIDLCRLIYKNLSIKQKKGKYSFISFLVNMNKLFEDFIRQYLINNLLNEKIKKTRKSNWAEGGNQDILPMVEPDILIKDKLIIDTKYYKNFLTGRGKLININLYQIITYMNIFSLNGLLIYPENTSGIENIFIPNYNKSVSFSVKSIKLNGGYSDFRDSLQDLIKFIKNQYS